MTPNTLPTSEWLSTRQLAAEIGVAPVTLKTWRTLGSGPAFARIGRLIRYHRPAVAAWLASRTTSAGSVSAS